MDGISTILWDVGGVLLTNAWDHRQRQAVIPQFALDPVEFERRHAEVDTAWERGELTAEEYLRRTVFYEPRNFTPGDFLEAIRGQSTVLPDSGLGILRQLAASDEYVLATINNESREMNEYRLQKFDLLDDFEAFFTSCYLGVRKPDRRIYQIALDVLQRDPEEAVFIDDRVENVAAAAALGMHAIRYESSAQLADALNRLGVPVEQAGSDRLLLHEA